MYEKTILFEPHEKNQQSAYAKTKTQISFAVTAKLISAFVFATQIVQFLYFLNPEFPVSSHLLCLYSWVCVEPVRKLVGFPMRRLICLQVTSGEYIQMSGRAGRRGLDDRGIVILMVDEKMPPSAGKLIVKVSIMLELDRMCIEY